LTHTVDDHGLTHTALLVWSAPSCCCRSSWSLRSTLRWKRAIINYCYYYFRPSIRYI